MSKDAAELHAETLIAITAIKVELTTVSTNVAKISRVVIDGNGDSLVTKMAKIEGKLPEFESRLHTVEDASHAEAVSDAITGFKVKMLWGATGTLLALLAGTLFKMYSA